MLRNPNKTVTADYTARTVDTSGNVIASTPVSVTSDKLDFFKIANELNSKINEYDEDYIIVLASCNSWELYFSA